MVRATVSIVMLAVAVAVAATISASAAAATCPPTQSQGAGPIGSQTAVFPRRSTFGSGYVLSGRVLRSIDCKPLAGAVVEIWQAGKGGVYRKTGRASAVVGPQGTFRFEGPRPVGYEGRPGHIHMRVWARGYEDVLVTHFPPPGKRTGRLEIVMTSFL